MNVYPFLLVGGMFCDIVGEGVFTTPGYPTSYPNGAHQCWTFAAPPGYTVRHTHLHTHTSTHRYTHNGHPHIIYLHTCIHKTHIQYMCVYVFIYICQPTRTTQSSTHQSPCEHRHRIRTITNGPFKECCYCH